MIWCHCDGQCRLLILSNPRALIWVLVFVYLVLSFLGFFLVFWPDPLWTVALLFNFCMSTFAAQLVCLNRWSRCWRTCVCPSMAIGMQGGLILKMKVFGRGGAGGLVNCPGCHPLFGSMTLDSPWSSACQVFESCCRILAC